MLQSVAAAPPDPILGLTEAFLQDPRTDKINLTMGVYRDEQGQTPVLECVRKAEAQLLQSETTKGYLGIDGLPEYRRLATELTLGGLIEPARVVACQTPGGTGALRVAADFLNKQSPTSRVWCSAPTWPNHTSIFEAAGFETASYPYLAADRRSLDFSAWLDALRSHGRSGDVICLHACCHNPTGVDPTLEQWRELAEVTAEMGVFPLVDFAYHGFGDGLEPDRAGLAEIAKHHSEFLVCSSYSKNFGLYSERVGALLAVCPAAGDVPAVASQVKQTVRSNYSNPPKHGAAVVAQVLGDVELRKLWLTELDAMRDRIRQARHAFVQAMQATGCEVDYSFLLEQRGMFSYSGLTPLQVDWLRTNKGVYIVGSGRINVAGITPSNLGPLSAAIAQAVSKQP